MITDNTSEPEVVAEINQSKVVFCKQEVPAWARGALGIYLYDQKDVESEDTM
jgi:hypothetical protein